MNKKRTFLIGVVFILIVLASGVCRAEEEKGREENVGPHRLELLLGNTHDDGENGFTVGLGYEYRVNQFFGVGGLVEWVRDELREWVFAVPLVLHPYKGWRFIVGPGIQVERATSNKDFLFRVGTGYEFEIDRWSITPEFNFDIVDGEGIAVFGVSFGYGF